MDQIFNIFATKIQSFKIICFNYALLLDLYLQNIIERVIDIMRSFLSKFATSPKISHARLLLPLNLNYCQRFLAEINEVDPKSPALFISINGFLQQAEASTFLHDSIKHVSERKKVPVHTFLQDNINGLSYYVATAGKNIYANPFCRIGDLVVSTKTYVNIHKLLNYFGIKYERFGTNQTCLWNPNVQPSQKEQQFSKRWLTSIEQKLKASIPQKRNVQPSTVEEFGNKLIHPKKAFELRLVDKIATLDQFVQQHFPNNKIRESHFSNRPIRPRLTYQQVQALTQLTQWMKYPKTALMAMEDPLNEAIKNFVQVISMRLEDPSKLEQLDLLAGKLLSHFELQMQSQNKLII